MIYLKSITLENTGPIEKLHVRMPFEQQRPKPVIFVGPNGSGKSTALSFIVNALVAFKQHAGFENTEVEKGRVYRLRAPLGLKQANPPIV
jgi:ABC-type Mn2+/Zn2+ transport system ATPase subunit